MIINEKGKLFGKISVIDIFVLGSLVAVVLFGALRFGSTRGIGILQTPVPVSISFIQEEVEDFTADRVSLGDPVSANVFNVDFGHVIDMAVSPAIVHNPNSDGIFTPSVRPGFSTIEITTQIYAHETDNGIWVNGHSFFAGETVIISVGYTNLFVRISDITLL